MAKTSERDEFESRARPGIFLNYAPEGHVEILDLKEFRDSRTIRTVETGNYQMDSNSFPWRSMKIPVTEAHAGLFQFSIAKACCIIRKLYNTHIN